MHQFYETPGTVGIVNKRFMNKKEIKKEKT